MATNIQAYDGKQGVHDDDDDDDNEDDDEEDYDIMKI